jgi:putative Holliday junction resolvase
MNEKILAIDFGMKRLGLAISDEHKKIAFPHTTIRVKNRREMFEDILRILDQQRIGLIIVGLPLHMNGTESALCENVRQFAETLRSKSEIPVDLFDERLTSVFAEKAMLEGDLSRKKRRKVQDKLAATILLQGYLDYISLKERGN